jgi:o-succinylbenzoate synthase
MSCSVTVQPYAVRLARGVRNAQRSWSERRGLLVTVRGDGAWGQGDAAPLTGATDERLLAMAGECAKVDTSGLARVAALGMAAPERFLHELEHLELSSERALRFALEAALCDWVARRRAEPLHRFLATASGLERPSSTLPVAALVDPESALTDCEAHFARGFATIKLKVGVLTPQAEVAAIARLRAEFGASFRLRLDANRAWTAATARERLVSFAAHGIEFIEEPTASDERLIAPAIPVALDESLPEAATWPSAELEARGVTAWVLKPTLVGGIGAALRLARRARELGLGLVISHAFEGPVAFAALTELALAVGSPLAQGLGPHVALDGWASPLPAGHRGTTLATHAEAGLGLPAAVRVPEAP